MREKKREGVSFESVITRMMLRLIQLMEAIMAGQPEIESAIQALTASLTALAAAIASIPKPADEQAQVDEINALKAQIDALTAQLSPSAPSPAPVAGPPPAP